MPDVVAIQSAASNEHDPASRLDLRTQDIHDVARRGRDSALNRTSNAAPGARGSDLYHDFLEDLTNMLIERGWVLRRYLGQQRLYHPDGRHCVTIASAVNIGHPDPRKQPRTRHKGRATAEALDRSSNDTTLDLAEFDVEKAAPVNPDAPLWMILHELDGTTLRLALGRPAEQDKNDCVVSWSELVLLESLHLVEHQGDFDEDQSPDFDVSVTPRA